MCDLISEIQARNDIFYQAFSRGEIPTVAALYTEEATLLPPHANKAKGRDAIRGFWQAAFQNGVRELRLETVEAQQLGLASAYEIGKYRLIVTSSSRPSTSDVGKYVVVWRKVGIAWHLDVDIFNSDLPVSK